MRNKLNMSYNWEEIFKNKSNKELYNIYKGTSNLSDSTIPIAKNELINRNFDFDNMEANNAAWKLSSLIQEEDIYESEVNIRKLTYFSWKLFLLVITAITLFFFFIIPDSVNDGLPMILAVATFLYILNNYLYSQQQKYISKVRIEKLALIEKLEKKKVLKKDNPIFQDIVQEREKSIKSIKIVLAVTFILAIIFWIIRNMV